MMVVKHFIRVIFSKNLTQGIIALLALLAVLQSYSSAVSAANSSTAHIKGAFGPLHNWPIIPIAMMLMPDGRVFAYGTNTAGAQGATMYYAIWDPSLGTNISAFSVLPNTTNTDIFALAMHSFQSQVKL